ncbi:hypothetical protein ACIBTZ_20485 [Micromonospora sp. NPDC049460]|uniref:hypothetical protein n=1 Tax=unclassified Micromonospora TaxID=2617518 RepID=UPI003718463E
MLTTRRALTAAGAALLLVAAVLVVVVGNHRTAEAERATLAAAAAGPAAPVLLDERLREVLLPKAEHPAGTELVEMSLADAGKLFEPDPDVTVSPVACLGSLQLAIGEQSRVAGGWIQVGSRRDADKGATGRFTATVEELPEGLDLARLREAAGTCTSGSMTWRSLKVGARITLAEVPVPALDGAATYGLQSTITFTGLTQQQFDQLVADSCSIEAASAVVAVGWTCDEGAGTVTAVNQPAGDFTVRQYQLYVARGSHYLEICEPDLATAISMSETLYGRLRSVVK